jgi:heat shock protein HtpX
MSHRVDGRHRHPQNATVPDAPPTTCRRCSTALVEVDDEPPWCEKCEWNLDALGPTYGVDWVRRRIRQLDRRAGFRADRRLASLAQEGSAPRVPAGYLLLLAVSGVLVLLMAGMVATGLWLVVTGRLLPPILLGLLLIGAAYGLRPRLGRVKPLLKGSWRLEPTQAPVLQALVARVAERTGAPAPDVIALDLEWNASASVVGFRRTRVLMLGVPMLLALREQQLVALLGHELGHFQYEDNTRRLFIQPALTVFGAVSEAVRPPAGTAIDRDLHGVYFVAFTVLQVVAGLLSWLLFAVHVAMHVVASPGDRRDEIRADMMAARAAGSAAALQTMDALALMPLLQQYVQPNVEAGQAARRWRDAMAGVPERNRDRLPVLRQLSIREDASLLASHPAPGRRHQYLSSMPYVDPAVVVTESEAARIDAEVAPYAEALRKELADDGF